MRNIKSTLRMTRNSGMLFAAVSGLLYLTACTSDVLYDAPNENITESNVIIGNDPAAQAHRIHFFGNQGTRGGEDVLNGVFPEIPDYSTFTMKKCPKFDTPNAAQQSQDENKKIAYELTGGEGQIELYGGEVYITGNVTTHNFNPDNGNYGTVYVMPGAKLTLKDEVNNSSAKIVVWGEIEAKGTITNGTYGQILVNKDLYVKELNNGGTVVVNGNLTIEKPLQFNGGTGKVKGKCIYIEKEGGQALNMSGGGVLAIGKYLSCYGMIAGNNARIYFWPNAIAEVDQSTYIDYAALFSYYEADGNTDGNALLKTNKIKFVGGYEDPAKASALFNKNLKVQYNEIENPKNDNFQQNFVPSANDYPISEDPCSDSDEPTFTPIALIEVPTGTGTHEHNHLSATCVQEVGEGENARAYVSYHLNAEYEDNEKWAETSEHMGCVEVYDVNENSAQITSWLMNQDFDFNHLIVDDNKVYTVGDTKKYGATLGVIDLAKNGSFQYDVDTEGREGIMIYYNLYTKNGKAATTGSGNCLIRDNNTFRIASYNGFQSFDVNDLTNQTNFISTSGSAKHIAKPKNGNHIVTLNLDEKKVDASTATVNVYNTWGTSIATFNTDKLITPIDGKNVIATDGNNIYVALGEKGVDKYDMSGTFIANYCWITEKLEENPDYVGRPLANGLCVDDEYVYVANGAAGMIVLDKNTMERVARYSRSTQIEENGEVRNFSANYVQKVGNLIYIAYGRNGLEVVKMTEPATAN